MAMPHAEMLAKTRSRILRSVEGISSEELLWVPPGFRNNILWNLGHILVVQQAFHYRLAGQPPRIPEDLFPLFRSGTSPDDWAEVPDPTLVLRLLEETARSLVEDYREGRLSNYEPYTLRSGMQVTTIEEALAFNSFHEGLHGGTIECMRRLWRQREKAPDAERA